MLDVAPQVGEHPLAASQRFLNDTRREWLSTVKDYQATFYKQERIDGEVGELEVSHVKLRHKPFSAHILYISPFNGRECVYQANADGSDGMLYARDSGWRKSLGVFELSPTSTLAMKGQLHPITMLGIAKLMDQMIESGTRDMKFGECQVSAAAAEVGLENRKRPVTLVEVVHPYLRREFTFHIARVFLDNELRVPIRYEEYGWPETVGSAPPLVATYTYLDVKVNTGLTDADFSSENPETFK